MQILAISCVRSKASARHSEVSCQVLGRVLVPELAEMKLLVSFVPNLLH